jgi:hypothetical protein
VQHWPYGPDVLSQGLMEGGVCVPLALHLAEERGEELEEGAERRLPCPVKLGRRTVASPAGIRQDRLDKTALADPPGSLDQDNLAMALSPELGRPQLPSQARAGGIRCYRGTVARRLGIRAISGM